MENMQQVDDLALSANGKLNAHYHHCPVVQRSTGYANCLHLIESSKNHKLSIMYSSCEEAIRSNGCQAMLMREQEIKAGKAIFFKQRERIEELEKIERQGLSMPDMAIYRSETEPTQEDGSAGKRWRKYEPVERPKKQVGLPSLSGNSSPLELINKLKEQQNANV